MNSVIQGCREWKGYLQRCPESKKFENPWPIQVFVCSRIYTYYFTARLWILLFFNYNYLLSLSSSYLILVFLLFIIVTSIITLHLASCPSRVVNTSENILILFILKPHVAPLNVHPWTYTCIPDRTAHMNVARSPVGYSGINWHRERLSGWLTKLKYA